MQALNILELQITAGSIIQKLTPVNVMDGGMMEHGSNTAPLQAQPVTLVSFASTTQVRLDTAIPLPASQVPPKVTPVQVPLSQITSVASTSNVAPSLTSQQMEMTSPNQDQQWSESKCRKCGKKESPDYIIL